MRKLLNTIKEYKTFIIPWVALVGVIAILASGLTYAYFDFVADSENESSMKITATNLNVNLSMSTVNLNNMMPIYDEYKDTKANTFTFTMSNTSRKLSGCVDLYLGINTITKQLANEDFKWELTNNTTSTTTRGSFATIDNDRLLIKENENIPISTTYSYTLKIWYSYRNDIDQSFVFGSTLNSKLISVAYGGACSTPVSTSYTTVGTTQFTAAEDGYYRIETFNINGDYASGEIMLADNEKLYFSVSDTAGTPTSVKCYADSKGVCGTQGSQNENNSRIMYAKTDLTNSFISGYAGVNAPTYVTSSNELSNNTIHPTGKFFLNGKLEFGTNDKTPKVVVTYLGKYKERDTKFDNVRYVKSCISGNTVNENKHWIEIQAIKNGVNLAYKKTITGTAAQVNNNKPYTFIVDGQITNATWSTGYGQTSVSGTQCVTIDLGKNYDLDEVAVWHYYDDGRTYYDDVLLVSSDNSTWTEIMNETKTGATIETINGKRVSAYKEAKVMKPTYIVGTSAPREVRIGTEEFYVLNDIIDYPSLVSTNGDIYNYGTGKIILLAKYNLYVGQMCTTNNNNSCAPISTSDSKYGLQSADAEANVLVGGFPVLPTIGVVPFSGSGYWYENSTVKPEYGTSYNASNVYDTNYIAAPNYSLGVTGFYNNSGNANYSIAYYIEEYVRRLGINGTGRLLTYTEASVMTPAQRTSGSASYWLGSAMSGSFLREVMSTGELGYGGFHVTRDSGVRPVIVMDASEIDYIETMVRAGTDTTTGLPVVRIGTEEFLDLTNAINYTNLINVYGNIYNYGQYKSILLSKYNLYVGRIASGSSPHTYTSISTSDSKYGLQSADAIGWINSSSLAVAVVPFAGSSTANGYWYDTTNSTIKSQYGTNYNLSNIYDKQYMTAPNYSVAFSNNAGNANYSIAYYVEEYVNRLRINGTGRLLTYTEANALGQTKRTNGARYWLGSAKSNTNVWYVLPAGTYGSDGTFSIDYGLGVRPVIVVDTADIQG